ncbi:PaaI family thioesterase [Faecalibacter sp. LW9]|uniref:PaaI family thioesterase n=1 Tax=Faecalibacter sp. LW9 TaxID=3103144 RepID=UPI002B001453|nr:PaaI family thioesterase [Faecalibacter sp. LW9]
MTQNKSKAIQDLYTDELAHCYGCGKNNPFGYQLKTYLMGDETIAHFTPDEKFTAIPGSVYGGLIASLLDCHGTGSAAAFAAIAENIDLENTETIPVRCVTASLKVDFKAPTPMGTELELIGKLRSIEGRKIWVDMTLSAGDILCATGEILAIKIKSDV